MKPVIYPNVEIAEGSWVDIFVIIGQPPRGKQAGELRTVIGPGAMIRSHTVIYAGNRTGRNLETGHHVMIREENEIGNYVSIGTGTVIEHHVKIADNARIHSRAFIPEYCILEEGCWIGPNVVLTNAKYPNRPETKQNLQGVIIGAKAVVGANATILPGVKIGEGALIGAGAVVTKDIPPGALATGNPATIVKYISKLT